jgi:hypothetical protein
MLCFPLSKKIESRRLPQPPKTQRKGRRFPLAARKRVGKVVVFTGQTKHSGLSRCFRWLPEKYMIKVVVSS